ncbi:MAG: PIN domain-containing protein [Candidatus Melainabacteria bacterium]|jgi:hypothetical protein
MYIFDTSSLKQLFKFYPKRFPSLWQKFGNLMDSKKIISVKEVLNEIENYGDNDELKNWAKENKAFFQIPTSDEALFISKIYQVKHFQQGLESKKLLKGGSFADPFLVAKAKITDATLITEEKFKPNGTKIPNICKHFEIKCKDLEEFMEQEHWSF